MADAAEGKRRRVVSAVAVGLFLVGLAVLFHLDALWPWILALVGAFIIIEAVAKYFLS